MSVLVRVSIVVRKYHNPKESWGEKGLFCLFFHIAVHHLRKSAYKLKQDRILEAGADEEAM